MNKQMNKQISTLEFANAFGMTTAQVEGLTVDIFGGLLLQCPPHGTK